MNVSRFGPQLAGAGGFINITQNARRAGVRRAPSPPAACGSRSTAGELRIVKEGSNRKFVKAVEQITFNGAYAAEKGQPVLYVTERCVFRRTAEGMELVEVAPGIDIERDILAHMDFEPIIAKPADRWTRASSATSRCSSTRRCSASGLAQRVSYDLERNILFAQLGRHARADARRRGPRPPRDRGARARTIGRKVALVANYDNFLIDAAVARYLRGDGALPARRTTTPPPRATRPARSCA